MILSNIRNIDLSETFFVIIQNLDKWVRCCVKSSIYSSGTYNVQKSTQCFIIHMNIKLDHMNIEPRSIRTMSKH